MEIRVQRCTIAHYVSLPQLVRTKKMVLDENPCATLHRCTIPVTATVSKNEENGSGWRHPDNVAPLLITCCTATASGTKKVIFMTACS